MTVLVRVLPSPDKTAEVRDLLELAVPHADIVTKVFGPKDPGGFYIKAVRAILADPHGYDTDVDEVAVARALEGDRGVWEGLTHYERREVMLAIHARRELEYAANRDDRAGFTGPQWTHEKGWQYVAPNERIPDWLENLAEMTGWTARRLGQEVKDYAEARVL